MIAAIVAPVGIRNIAMMRACLVLGRAADLDDAGAGCLRDPGLAVFRAVVRGADSALDLDLVMGSSEVDATPYPAPPRPPLGQPPASLSPRSPPAPPPCPPHIRPH